MGKAAKRPKMGRPPLPVSERKLPSMAFRPTPDVRRKLEEAAAESGRSMSQEMQSRLEHSLQDQDAREREMGGRELLALFRMLGAVAEVIEERTGKKWSEDWDTGLAVQVAWKALIGRAMPLPSSEYHRAVNIQDEFPPLPTLPELPKRPSKSGLVPQSRLYKNEAEYQADLARWEADRAQREEAAQAELQKRDKIMRDLLALVERLGAAVDVGREAAELFPPTQSRD